MSSEEDYHNHQVKRIITMPTLIGLDNIIFSCSPNIYENSRMVGQPDGLFYDKFGHWFVMEYKNTPKGKHRAKEQLRVAEYFFMNKMGFQPKKLYVQGDGFQVEEVI